MHAAIDLFLHYLAGSSRPSRPICHHFVIVAFSSNLCIKR